MKDQLLLAWRVNNENNLLLLKSIGEEQLTVSLSGKGRNVGEQMAHLHNVRLNWIQVVAKAIYQDSLLLSKNATLTISVIADSLNASAEKITQIINISWEKEGRLPSYKAGLVPFIAYLVSHESHHRGTILLTLKQSGFKLPDALKWGLWNPPSL